jgi:hypothetical protein
MRKRIKGFPLSFQHLHRVSLSAAPSRISDIRPRILLRQAMNGRFGEAASRRWHTLDRRLWADHVDTAAFASRKARRAAAKQL